MNLFVMFAIRLFVSALIILAAWWTLRKVWNVKRVDPAAFVLYVKGFFGNPLDSLGRSVREQMDVEVSVENVMGMVLDVRSQPKGHPELKQYRIKFAASGGDDVVKNVDALIALPLPAHEYEIQNAGGAVSLQFGPRADFDGGSWSISANTRLPFPGRLATRQLAMRAHRLDKGQATILWVVLDHRPHPRIRDEEIRPRVPSPGGLLVSFTVETPDGEIPRNVWRSLDYQDGNLVIGEAAPEPDWFAKLPAISVESVSD